MGLLRGIGAWVHDLDIFGHPVTVFYKGSDTYKTRLGVLCTFAVYTLTLSYMYIQLGGLWTMSDPDVLIITKTLHP